MIDLKKIKKIHFTGIKGVGLTALALVAKDMGFKISGSDVAESFVTDEALKKAGIKTQIGFNEKRIKDADLVIFSAGHGGSENIEVQSARKQAIPILSHAQALALLVKSKKAICVAGVGGKTTTSSMIATVFQVAGVHPSYAIGVGGIRPLGLPAKFDKKGKYFVAEADEYFSPPPDSKPKFWYQNPFVAVITNLEYDHPDVYKNLEHTLKVFAKFIERTPKEGLVLVCIDNPNTEKLIQFWPKTNRPLDEIKVPISTYGFSRKADWQITLIDKSEEKISFNLKYKNKVFKNIELNIPGEFNVRNAAAAFAVGRFCGISPRKIREGLKAFKGTQRRFELIREIKGIKLYDDYAHHPVQIKATLKGARDWFGKKRIIVVFQPHTYSRTKALLKEFSLAFNEVDLVIITDIYASAREKDNPTISGRLLAKKIKEHQANVVYQGGEKEVASYLGKIAKKGDVIFTLGAGDIFKWHNSIAKAIERNQK